MSAWVELFDGRRGEIVLKVAGNKAWVRTLDGQELVDLADVAPIDPTPVRRCGVAKPKRPKLPQLPAATRPVVAEPESAFVPTPWASHAMDHWGVRTPLRKTFRGPSVTVNPESLDRFRRANRPAPIAGSHAHYWLLDSASLGTCTLCGAVRDFREKALLDLDPHNAGHRKPRKEADFE